MKKFFTPLVTVIVFLMLILLFTFIWYQFELHQSSEEVIINSFEDFLLYLLGYGDVQLPNIFSKTLFSIISLLGLTLFSSVFTVSLFELRSKIKIQPKIYVWDKTEKLNIASVVLVNGKKDMYNLNASLILSYTNEIQTEEKCIPFIPKNTVKMLDFYITPGSVFYNFFRFNLKDKYNRPILVFTATYTDIVKGQEYTICKKFQYYADEHNDFVFLPQSVLKAQYENISHNIIKELEKSVSIEYEKEMKEKLDEYVSSKMFAINLASANPINGEDIDILYGYYDELMKKNFSQNQAFEVNVHMDGKTDYNPKDFSMVCVSRPLDGDWTKYYDLGCHFNFDYLIENLTVVLEIKATFLEENREENLSFKLAPTDGFKTFSLRLNDKNRDFFQSIKEICFTVFYENVNITDPNGHFVITDCTLEVKDSVPVVSNVI